MMMFLKYRYYTVCRRINVPTSLSRIKKWSPFTCLQNIGFKDKTLNTRWPVDFLDISWHLVCSPPSAYASEVVESSWWDVDNLAYESPWRHIQRDRPTLTKKMKIDSGHYYITSLDCLNSKHRQEKHWHF